MSISNRQLTTSLVTTDATLHNGQGLSRRGRVIVWILALLLIVFGMGSLAAAGIGPITGSRPLDPAQSGPVNPQTGTNSANRSPAQTAGNDPRGPIRAEWDGPTTHLDWHGQTYATATADFLGERTASPGDRVQRTLTLQNDGPSDAAMTVSLDLNKITPDGTLNAQLAENIILFWNVGGVTGQQYYSTLMKDQGRVVAEVAVPHADRTNVTVGFEMPSDVTGVRNAGSESTILNFRVIAEMRGETAALPPLLSLTGINPFMTLAIAGTAIGLALVGLLLLAVARRRLVCSDCETVIQRSEEWTLHHESNGSREYRCAECNRAETPERISTT